MKIAVFGSYNGTSIGDTAILLGLLHGIAQVTPDARVTVLTMGPIDLSRDLALTGLAHLPRMVRANVRGMAEWPLVRSLWWRLERLGLPLSVSLNTVRCRKLLKGQDLLIIGGGNLLMDLFEGGIGILENVVGAARAVGTPYVFAGVGAGPVTQDISRRRLTVCLHHARRVSVRDEPSRQICTQWLGRPDAECAPDPAFALAPPHARARRKVLAVNVAAIGAPTWPVQDADGYRTYLDGLSALVVAAAAQMGLDAIEIVTTNPAVDLCAARDLAARLQGQTSLPVTLPPLRDVTDVLDAFAGAELAIVTRLHAGIMAAIAGCRVLPIAYQPKVAAVLAEQGIVQNVIVLEDIRLPDFDAAFSLHAACQHPAGVPPQTRAQALAAIRDLLQGGTAGEGHT